MLNVLITFLGAYNMEELCDIKWNVIGYALLLIYHFSILVIFAVVSSMKLLQTYFNILTTNLYSQPK